MYTLWSSAYSELNLFSILRSRSLGHSPEWSDRPARPLCMHQYWKVHERGLLAIRLSSFPSDKNEPFIETKFLCVFAPEIMNTVKLRKLHFWPLAFKHNGNILSHPKLCWSKHICEPIHLSYVCTVIGRSLKRGWLTIRLSLFPSWRRMSHLLVPSCNVRLKRF